MLTRRDDRLCSDKRKKRHHERAVHDEHGRVMLDPMLDAATRCV